VIFFYAVHWLIFQNGGSDYAALSVLSFSIQYFFLFMIAFSLSAASDNFIVLTISSGFTMFILFGLLYFSYYLVFAHKYSFDFRSLSFKDLFVEASVMPKLPKLILTAVILVLPFVITQVICFKKFDLRPGKVYNRRFFKLLIPLFLVGLLGTFLITSTVTLWEHHTYYLTSNHKLLESNYFELKIHDQKQTYTLGKGYSWFFDWNCLDSGEYLTFQGDLNFNNKEHRGIIKIDLNSYTPELLYSPKKTLTYYSYFYNTTQLILEEGNKPDEIVLVLVDTSTGRVSYKTFSNPRIRGYKIGSLKGTGIENNQRFWLLDSYVSNRFPLLRLWEDGRVDDLGILDGASQWINGMLIVFTKEGSEFYRLNGELLVPIKKIPGRLGVYLWYFSKYLDLNFDVIYGKDNNKILMLDMQTLETKEIGETSSSIHFAYPDIFYFQETNDKFMLYILKDGKVQFIMESPYRFEVYPTGILLIDQSDKAVKAYSLPDLKELKFPGLK